MLINCPKCGFSQPKDRYCASCGVDMEQFRPVPPSIWKQIWVSPVFLVGLTLAVVMASVVFIRQKQNEEIAARAELLRAGPVIVESSSTPAAPKEAQAEPPPPAETPAEAATPAAVPANAVNVASTSPAAKVAAKAFASSLPADSAAAEAKPEARTAATAIRKVNMVATYAVIPKVTLDQLEAESQATGQFTDFGEFRAGALPATSDHARGVRVLQRVSKTFEGKSGQQRWFVGAKGGDEQELGMTALVTLENSTDGHIRGEVELLRSLPETDSYEIIRKSYPISSFDLAPRMGWMIHLTDLPRKLNLGADAFGTDGFLSLFRVDTYMNGNADFTLFLDFDSPTP